MPGPADVCRVHIERSESDAYSTDLSFTFVVAGGDSFRVQAVPAAPDVFGIKAHTFAKILTGAITLPRTLDFGFAKGEGRYVHFTFSAGMDGAILLRCSACGDREELGFDVRDRGALERLLEVFRYLDAHPGGECIWESRLAR